MLLVTALALAASPLVGCGDDGGGAAGSGGHGGQGDQGGGGPSTSATGGGGAGQGGGAEDFEIVRSDAPYDDAPDATSDEIATMASGEADFAARLVHAARGDAANFVVSPSSIRSAFGMLYGGSTGVARDELETTMRFELGERVHPTQNAINRELLALNAPGTETVPEVVFARADSFFADHGFAGAMNPDYLDLLSVHYDTGVRIVPFDTDTVVARERINGWVADLTRGRIPALLDPLPAPGEVSMALVNALYLKASWSQPFEESATAQADFTTDGGGTVSVDLMDGITSGRYAEADGWQAAGIPYGDGRLEMIVIVPPADGVPALDDAMSGALLDEVTDALAYDTFEIFLPKIELRTRFDLRSPLVAMGMPNAIQNPAGGYDGIPFAADFVQMPHEAFIAVDEKGTEAAAATAIVGQTSGVGGGPNHEVRADHPFYLVIRDQVVGATLFFGRIGDPSAS